MLKKKKKGEEKSQLTTCRGLEELDASLPFSLFLFIPLLSLFSSGDRSLSSLTAVSRSERPFSFSFDPPEPATVPLMFATFPTRHRLDLHRLFLLFVHCLPGFRLRCNTKRKGRRTNNELTGEQMSID